MATSTCAYRTYNAANDFSSTQGSNGWYYGYYSGTIFTQFSNYAISTPGSLGSVYSWNYNVNSNGNIGSSIIMPNGATACNTASYGDITPVLRWYNPINSCYQDITITFSVSHSSSNGGIVVGLTVNGNSIYSNSNGGSLTYSNTFNAYSVSSVELSIGPLNHICDNGQTTYSLNIAKIGPSNTALASISPTLSASSTATVVTNNTVNFCSTSGRSVTLPFIGSSVLIMTNNPGTNFGNNWNCNIYIYGAGSSQVFNIYFHSFITETNYDFLTIYNSANQILYRSSGNLGSFSLLQSGPYIQLLFTSDGSNVATGITATITLAYSSQTTTTTQSPKYTGSATATSTVFYTGNWIDLGQYNYAQGDIANLGSMTINQCQINCWQNSLCGVIVVTSPCYNIPLDSPLVYTTVCGQCWLKLTYGWTIGEDGVSRSIKLYDRFVSVTSSVSSTVSPLATSSVIMYSSYDMCISSGTIVTLPFLTSSVLLKTNMNSNYYSNNANCKFYVNGAGNAQALRVTINSMITESCCDFISVYDASNNLIIKYSGTYNNYSFLVTSSSIYIQFTSDTSVVYSGISLLVDLEYASLTSSSSVSPSSKSSSSATSSSSSSNSVSYSALNTKSLINSYSVSVSSRISKSTSISPSLTSSGSISLSGLKTNSMTYSISPRSSNSMSSSISPSLLNSISSSLSNSITPSSSPSSSSSISSSITPSISPSSSSSSSNSISSSITPSSSSSISLSSSNSITSSSSNSISPSSSSKYTITPTPSYINLLPFSLPPPGANYNTEVTNQLNNFLSDLLTSGNKIEPAQALSVINTIPPVGVSDTMNLLKKLSGLVAEPLSFSSSSFEGSLSPMKNTTVVVNSSLYEINVPIIPNLPPNSAVTAISWTNTTSFSNETTLSNIMSVSVSNKGVNHIVENLTTPLILNWNIPNISTPHNMTLKCSYWDYNSSSWKSDGCNTTIVNNNIICSCSHMTDFVARFDRILEMNQNIFKNAGSVYSLEGLEKYKNYYIFYGCYFIVMILIGSSLQQLDIKNSKQYLKALKDNIDILKFKKEEEKFYIDKCHINSEDEWDFTYYNDYLIRKTKLFNEIHNSVDESIKNNPNYNEIINIILDEKLEETNNHIDNSDNNKRTFCQNVLNILNIWRKRLLYQHNYLSILFKYDPESPRIFRIFFIFTVISHTLFMTAFLYGYVHTTSGSVEDASPIESIVLSIITSLINVPFMNIIIKILILAGKSEFEWRYPFIYREIKKMVIFEEVYHISDKKNNNISSEIDPNNEELHNNNNEEEDLFTSVVINFLCRYCYKKDKTKKIIDKDLLFKDRIDKEIIKIDQIPTKYQWWYSSYIPFHTIRSFTSFVGCLGYLIWTINYLLLFTAESGSSIQIQIMKSFGISQLFSIVLITPIILFLTLLFTWILHKYVKKTKFNSISSPLYYHSDPFVNEKSIGLTVRLSKSLFLDTIASSSIHQPTDNKIIAPLKGLIAELLKEGSQPEINREYYNKIIKYNEINKNIK
jgi:hypothetical protein